jgi:hypothetical protein
VTCRMRRRLLLVLVLLGLVVPMASAPAGAAEICGNANLGTRLDCLGNLTGRDHGSVVLVYLSRQIPLGSGFPPADLKKNQSEFGTGPVVVSVPKGQPTGPGGTILLILAGRRLVAPDSVISPLDAGTVRLLKAASVCGTGSRTICDLVSSKTAVSGASLIGNHFADDYGTNADPPAPAGNTAPIRRTSTPRSAPAKPGSGSHGGSGTYLWYVLVVVVLGALAVGVIMRRSSVARSAGAGGARGARLAGTPPGTTPVERTNPPHRIHQPSAPPAPPSGLGRTAVVRTALRPQGYVEIDHCLVRAAWADPGTPPPALGERVAIVRGTGQDADLFFAYPATTDSDQREKKYAP